MTRSIKQGDIVDLYYNDGSQYLKVKVLHVPSDTGDFWYFEISSSKDIFAQNPMSTNFDSIIKIKSTNSR